LRRFQPFGETVSRLKWTLSLAQPPQQETPSTPPFTDLASADGAKLVAASGYSASVIEWQRKYVWPSEQL
jgi:hypothetical protein